MLNYVMQAQEVNEALSLFSRLFDLRIAFFDANDTELFIFDVKERSAYCKRMRNLPDMRPLCEQCDCRALAQTHKSREIEIYHCHRGLIEAVVPLFDSAGTYLGSLMFGQLRDSKRPIPPQRTRQLQNDYQKLNEASLQKVREIADLLKYISEAIIEKAWLMRCQQNWEKVLDEYIDEHIHETLKVETLARAANCSVSFITHNFQAKFGATPQQYIRKKKMILARQRLLEGQKVQDVAHEFGFFDPYHFSRSFRKYYGYPPSQIRGGRASGK